MLIDSRIQDFFRLYMFISNEEDNDEQRKNLLFLWYNIRKQLKGILHEK